ncbi:MAG: hypothetical protein RLZ84_243 [Actinomycetota bacterium]|jgi:hypothetical protein
MSSSLESMNAELGAAAEAVARYRDRMADLATSMQGNHEDLVSAIYEAERALLTAHRLVLRAQRLAR